MHRHTGAQAPIDTQSDAHSPTHRHKKVTQTRAQTDTTHTPHPDQIHTQHTHTWRTELHVWLMLASSPNPSSTHCAPARPVQAAASSSTPKPTGGARMRQAGFFVVACFRGLRVASSSSRNYMSNSSRCLRDSPGGGGSGPSLHARCDLWSYSYIQGRCSVILGPPWLRLRLNLPTVPRTTLQPFKKINRSHVLPRHVL